MKIYLLPAGLFVVGFALLVVGLQFPPLAANWDQTLLSQPRFQHISSGNDQSLADEWYAAKAKTQSPRYACEDWGLAVAFFGIGLGALMAHIKVRRWSDISRLCTPSNHRAFVTQATVVWLSFIPSVWLFYIYTSVRGDYPGFGDIVFIPMVGDAVMGVLVLPLVWWGVTLTTSRRSMPVSLWSRPMVRWTSPVAIIVWIALFLALLVLAFGVVEMPPIIPSSLFTIYLLLCGRATAVHPRSRRILEPSLA